MFTADLLLKQISLKSQTGFPISFQSATLRRSLPWKPRFRQAGSCGIWMIRIPPRKWKMMCHSEGRPPRDPWETGDGLPPKEFQAENVIHSKSCPFCWWGEMLVKCYSFLEGILRKNPKCSYRITKLLVLGIWAWHDSLSLVTPHFWGSFLPIFVRPR